MTYRRIRAGLNRSRHRFYTFEKSLRPCFGVRRSVVMERHEGEVCLSEFEPDRLDLVDHELQRHDAHSWLRQMNLRFLFEYVHRISAPGPERDHGGIALLGLKQEGAEIGGSKRRSHMADNRAAELFDRRNAITFKRVPEGEVRTDEKPFVSAGAENSFHRTGRRAIGIPRPVD